LTGAHFGLAGTDEYLNDTWHKDRGLSQRQTSRHRRHGDERVGRVDIEAVIFDWGGTLTAWHDVDFHAESLALAEAVRRTPGAGHDVAAHAAELHRAGATVWGWSRDEQRSATIDDLFAEAGLDHDPELLTAYYEFWEPHTLTDPQVGPMWTTLRQRGIRVGVLSNTIWPRAWHEGFFRRDDVLHLLDGDVYTSEIASTKPSPEAFKAAMTAVGVADPARCVYVGDRLFDDVWGAHNAGMRAIHVPHSRIPAEQVGHTEGEPDAVAHELAEIPRLVAGLCSA
jgi:putative hydrolase of the HAD superfamily